MTIRREHKFPFALSDGQGRGFFTCRSIRVVLVHTRLRPAQWKGRERCLLPLQEEQKLVPLCLRGGQHPAGIL